MRAGTSPIALRNPNPRSSPLGRAPPTDSLLRMRPAGAGARAHNAIVNPIARAGTRGATHHGTGLRLTLCLLDKRTIMSCSEPSGAVRVPNAFVNQNARRHLSDHVAESKSALQPFLARAPYGFPAANAPGGGRSARTQRNRESACTCRDPGRNASWNGSPVNPVFTREKNNHVMQ